MLLVMVVSLFTVRIVLNALGASDYGLYNVVGGVISMFTVLVSTVTTASTRFFSYELGRGDYKRLSEYFSTIFWCFILIAIIIVILAETIGLWFVINKLEIPEGRLDAAIWVYECAIISFLVNLISIPFNALIVARERMNIYAYIGIIDSLLKLAIAYLLLIVVGDKLKWYACFIVMASTVVSSIYVLYGRIKFPETKLKFYLSKTMFKDVISYSSWVLFGAVAGICRNQGINILLNLFFNTIVNAARGISVAVSGAINGFVTNFINAVNPQIIKYYAANQHKEMLNLAFRTSRFCTYLMLVLSLPVLLETPFILKIWLKQVPEYTVIFTRLVILNAVIDSVNYALMGVISATGKIKYYQMTIGGILILNLPLSWICLKMGAGPEVAMYIAIFLTVVAVIVRVLFAHHLTGMSIYSYFKEVIWVILITTIVACILPILCKYYLMGNDNWMDFLVVTLVSIVSSCIAVCFVGMKNEERKNMLSLVYNKIRRK